MLDIGGWEFLVVAFVLVMVVGPKELPRMLRSFTGIMRHIRRMASEFTQSMTDLANDADVADLKKSLDSAKSGNLDDLANAIDPGGDVGNAVGDLASSVRDGATGDDLEDISKVAKTAGDQMASEANKPETLDEPTAQSGKAGNGAGKKQAAKAKS